MYLLQIICVIIVISFGIPAVSKGVLSIRSFSLLYSYSTQFFQPIQTLTSLLNSLQSILTSAERTQLILKMNPEIVDNNDSINVDKFICKIEFENVYFRYDKNQDYVLKIYLS